MYLTHFNITGVVTNFRVENKALFIYPFYKLLVKITTKSNIIYVK